MDYATVALCVMFVSAMAVAGRAHGSASKDEFTGAPTGWPTWDKLAAVVFFGVSFGTANYAIFGTWWLALLGAALTMTSLSTGHGRFYAMNGASKDDDKLEKIERLFGWMYWGDVYKPGYSWFCLGVKGLGVGLAAAPFGLALAVLWPFSYWLSIKLTDDTAVADWLRAWFSGLLILACFFLA